MRPPESRRAGRLVGWLAALGATVVLAAAVPATSSAFTASITNSTDSAVSKTRFTCADTFAGDRRRSSAYFEFALAEPADAATAADSSDGDDPGTYRGSNAKDATTEKAAASSSACPNDSGSAYRLDGSTSRVSTSRQLGPITGNFSEEVWFKTSAAGKILGFEATVDDRSPNYDKHLYVGGSGKLFFGIYNGSLQTLTSPATVTDGLWHYAVATTSSSGSVLYLDGVQVDANAGYVTAEGFRGYWRIGWGNLDSWPDAPGGDSWFTGAVRFAAAYPYVLTAQEVASAWSIGRPGRVQRVDPQPTASASATPEPIATAAPADTAAPTVTAAPADTATPAATETPAPASSATAAPGSGPVKSGSAPTYAPVSTAPEEQ